MNIRIGSVAAVKSKFSSMAALERIADVLEEVFRAARIERLLSPEAAIQVAENRVN